MTSLGIQIPHWFKIFLNIVIVTIHYFIEYTERKPFWFQLTPFLSYLLIISWWDLLFVPRSMWNISMVSNHMEGWISISQKKSFRQISPWKVSNRSKIQHYTRSQGLPLNTASKELVDQDFLIDYAGCDEILECAGCPTLFFPFYFDFQVSRGEAFTTAYPYGLLSRFIHSI